MSFKLTALFVDSRREFPHNFAETLWPDIQFTNYDRVARLSDAVQKHLKADFNVCFITQDPNQQLTDFFTDISKLGRKLDCVFVQLLPGSMSATEANVLTPPCVPGFDIAIHEQISKIEYHALKDSLGIIWHKMEVGRRTQDLDSSVKLLMRLIDDASLQRKRGKVMRLQHGVTSLMRMHAEFDPTIFDSFLHRLTDSFGNATPEKKALLKIPLPLLKKSLPGLSEQGYQGVSNRVFRLLSDRFAEDSDKNS
jgi:hypothetical protein